MKKVFFLLIATVIFLIGELVGLKAYAQEVNPQTTEHADILTPLEHRRGTEQTFLTYPEWFLVFSPAEYAEFVKTQSPSNFPFVGHIQQFWQSYRKIYTASNDGYPFNFGYHVMIVVIGVSTTAEYGIRSAYETLIGRLTELTQSYGATEEDIYGARIAQEYVDFIRVRPWYEYNFITSLKGLWSQTSYYGKDNTRKWERKYALTTEYLAKAIYGWMIMKATKASYDAAGDTTAVVIDRMPESDLAQLPELKLLKQLPDTRVLVIVPRYQAFTNYATQLAKQRINFVEIAGNQGPILLSVLTDSASNDALRDGKLLFEQPVTTKPGWRRIGFVVPVAQLSKTLNHLQEQGILLEHIYDY